jgi:uncharacterized protein YjiS (DUF1127 family)
MDTISLMKRRNLVAVVPRPSGSALVGLIARWIARARSRRILRTLDDHQLADLGLSRDRVEFESAKPFWR